MVGTGIDPEIKERSLLILKLKWDLHSNFDIRASKSKTYEP